MKTIILTISLLILYCNDIFALAPIANFNAFSEVETCIVKGNIYPKIITEYYGAFREVVNPNDADCTVGCGFFGADISGVWLLTHFTTLYSLDCVRVDRQDLEYWHENWNKVKLEDSYVINKHRNLWADGGYLRNSSDVAYRIIQELKIMGVRKNNVIIQQSLDELGCPAVYFNFPNDNTERQIIFKKHDFSEYSDNQSLRKEFKNKLDVYIEKADEDTISYCHKHDECITDIVKSSGFVIVEKYFKYSSYFARINMPKIEDYRKRIQEMQTCRYGWCLYILSQQFKLQLPISV